MANRNAPRGLQAHEDNDAPLELCLIPSSDSVIVGKGDAVKTAGSSGAIGSGPHRKTVARVSAGDAIYGVVVGVYNHEVASASFSLDRNHRAASVSTYVQVKVARPFDKWIIQADNEGATLAAGDVGLNANLTGTGGGTTITDANTSTGMSTMVLDTSTKNTTATLQLKIVGFEDKADNAVGDTNPKVVVHINNCEVSGGTGTAGV